MANKKASGAIAGGYDEQAWQAEDDVRTLVRAAEIRKDPARLKRARTKAKEQLAAAQASAATVAPAEPAKK